MTAEQKKRWLRKLVPVFILIFGFILMASLVASRRKPSQSERIFPGVLVEVMEAKVEERHVTIRGNGTVKPRREVSLAPQVSGKVSWVAPNMVSGGMFAKGEVLFRIEDVDYRLAVEEARAAVAQTEYSYNVAVANADIARREWEIMKQNGAASEEPAALVLHEPQLKQAEANLASARAMLEKAELNLSRTTLTAPYDCRIRSEAVDQGEFLAMGAPAARLYATDLVEIEVGLPAGDLRWIETPGSQAFVRLDVGGMRYTWEGVVDRTLGVVDTMGRLARVVVQVRNPFEKNDPMDPELSIGSFVEVEIRGRRIPETIPVPRSAYHTNSTIWVSSPDSTLDIRTVTAYRVTPDEVFVASGLQSGERIVLTPLSGAADGLKLRLISQETAR